MILLTEIRHMWPEKHILIDRPQGVNTYTFLHFINTVEVVIDGLSVITKPHTCLIYSPKTPQLYRYNAPMVHDWFHFTVDDPDYFSKISLPTDVLLTPSHSEFITPIVKELEHEFFSDKSMGSKLMSAKSEELFIKLSRAVAGETPYGVSLDTEDRFRELRSDIFSDLSYPWTVPEMAKRVGLSPSRFYSTYRSVFGNSPMNDLINARIDAAKNKLTFGNLHVNQISDELGYNNVTHFMRQFLSSVGMSPGEYRKSSRR